MRIEIVVFDGFDELDVFGPLEPLANVAGQGADLSVQLVGAHGPGTVLAQHGTRIVVEHGLGAGAEVPDAVVVPGGGWLNRAPQGAWAQAQDGALPARLAELAPGLRWVASVCTGAFLLSAAGLLTGRPATTNRSAKAELAAAGARVLDHRVVDDGDVVTAGGLSAGIDLGLHLVEREAGAALADRVTAALEHQRSTDTWRRDAGRPVSMLGDPR
ncbi:DJ-1/PfpI family protein [Quadrisphaera oryzae]|uniref:DJ-1/PfpI family protein n=1 Tax=Quadrisphaera TaxID=317661 RepID=UPI00164466EF|nr:DJ-1/PfpI family protein [Quadrisphaera sp. RL12-1S]MBC3763521.1 DJ-1/PfpI family protein [Quadrisphaera sp. RL12-1S]